MSTDLKGRRITGVPFRVCLYLAANRGTVLFADEISERYDVKHEHIPLRLKAACADGLLIRGTKPGERYDYYSAGPTLEAML